MFTHHNINKHLIVHPINQKQTQTPVANDKNNPMSQNFVIPQVALSNYNDSNYNNINNNNMSIFQQLNDSISNMIQTLNNNMLKNAVKKEAEMAEPKQNNIHVIKFNREDIKLSDFIPYQNRQDLLYKEVNEQHI